MMKIKNIIMAFILVMALVLVPNVYAAEDIEIKNIVPAGKSDNATYCENPVIDGLSISFEGVTFKDKGDFVTYKVDVVNNSNEDYEINDGTAFSENKYFKYEFEFAGDSNIVPKKSTKQMTIKISYDKDIPASAFNDDGTFREENNMTINLTNKPVTTGNPKTGSGIVVALILLFLAFVAATSMVISNKTKLNKELIMILALALAIVPVTIYAAKMVTIKLDTEIIIDKNYHFYFIDEDNTCGTEPSAFDTTDPRFSLKGANSKIRYIDEECSNGYIKEEYSFIDANVTWNDVLEEWDEDSDMLYDVFPEDSQTHVNGTDKLIHGMTYIWVLGELG